MYLPVPICTSTGLLKGPLPIEFTPATLMLYTLLKIIHNDISLSTGEVVCYTIVTNDHIILNDSTIT